MLLLMMIFFIYPTNFAITAHEQMGLGLHTTTLIMVGLDLIAFFAGLVFGQLMQIFRTPIKYFAPLFFLVGYLCFALAHGILSHRLPKSSLATVMWQEPIRSA